MWMKIGIIYLFILVIHLGSVCFPKFDHQFVLKLPQQRMMTSQRVCLLLLIVLLHHSTLSRHPRGPSQKFINHHIYGAMRVNECNGVINTVRRISLYNPQRPNCCKPTNTFIRATLAQVKAICTGGGRRVGEWTESITPFDIVKCTLRNRGEATNPTRLPRCEYRGSIPPFIRRIAIRCEEGRPVHYQADIIVLENWFNEWFVMHVITK